MLSPDNQKLRERSGEVTINSRLVGFLYDLMRDHLTPGKVEEILRNCSEPDIQYCNGYLAQYAQDIADRLTEETGD